MNTRTKYPVKKVFLVAKMHDDIIKRIARQMRIEHRGQASSENAVVRHMIEHCATCELFFSTISIDRNISTD